MAITIDDLTRNEIEGTGVFDELMRSVKAHLNEELAKGSITPVNYSSVYLGALQSTMQQSVTFLLEKDKSDAEDELIRAKILNIAKEGTLLDLQAQKLTIDIYNAKYEECLLKSKIASEEAGTQKTLQGTANSKTQASLITKQILKAGTEVKLYLQKIETEKAQIADKLDGVSIGGTIGKQNEMYRNQSNGYLRLAEQQNARLMLDAFSVLQSNGGIENFGADATMSAWGVTPAAVNAAISSLSRGVTIQSTDHSVKGSVISGTFPVSTSTEVTPNEPSAPTSCTVNVPPT